jgi:two-component system response regulator HydG
MATILHVIEDPGVARALEQELGRSGHSPLAARTEQDVASALATGVVELVIADAQPGSGPGALELLALLRRESHDVPLVVLAGHSSAEHVSTALRAGAAVAVAKPVQAEHLALAVEQALAHARLRRELAALRREVTTMRCHRQVIAESPAMRRTMQAVAMAAPTRVAVLLHGEAGTGRSLLARALHDESDRCDGPFVSLTASGLPERVIESMLFGNACDPFTGAPVRLEGAVERAQGGTLLLDEIDELPASLHARVLRLLQRQEYERVGHRGVLRANVRVLATSRRDPSAPMNGRPRHELLARLSSMAIAVPPLRERGDDIPMLAHRLAVRSAAELGRRFDRVSPEALALIRRAPWPGNVRELGNVIERALVNGDDPVLGPGRLLPLLPASARAQARALGAPAGAMGLTDVPAHAVVLTSLNVDQAERALIEKALALTNQNRTRTAALLGISVRTLRNKLNGPNRMFARQGEG